MQRGVSSGRVDDTREAAKKRFLTYTTQTFPIIQRYAEMGKCIKVDGSKSIEEVYAYLESQLGEGSV